MTRLFSQTLVAVIRDFGKTLIPGCVQAPLFAACGFGERAFRGAGFKFERRPAVLLRPSVASFVFPPTGRTAPGRLPLREKVIFGGLLFCRWPRFGLAVEIPGYGRRGRLAGRGNLAQAPA